MRVRVWTAAEGVLTALSFTTPGGALGQRGLVAAARGVAGFAAGLPAGVELGDDKSGGAASDPASWRSVEMFLSAAYALTTSSTG